MSILTLAAKAVSAVRCDDMATTSIWRVKGWLGKVVIYVENPDKTENPAFYEKQEMTDRQTQGLSDVIDYAVSSEKTKVTDEATEVMQQFVSGVNCHPATAREEMIAVKKRFGKEDGTVAYHGYQSFAPGEATPEMAHEIGAKLAQQLWGDKYQVIVATHLDKDSHLHNHFVVNTVSFLDGLKYHRTEKDYYEMQKASDALCREYNLSVIENPQRGKSKQYGEWRAEQEGRPTWRGLIRAEIDEVIRQSMTERQFFDNLRKRGYEVKVGKDISVRPPGKERFVRLERNFGEDYSYDGIRKRILAQFKRERPLPEPERKVRRARLRGDFKNTKKVTGFRALYFHYCYLLGIFPKNQPKHNKRLHFLLREDLAKLDAISEETKLLVRNRIDTVEQLSSYKEGLEAKIESLTADRKALYRKQRTVSVKTDDDALARVKEQITAISNELSVLRKEVRLCEDIPTLCTLREKLMEQPEEKAREIALSLELFTTGSLDIFGHGSNVDLDKRVVVFNIHDLGEQLKPTGLLVITDTMLNRVTLNWKRGKRTHVFIDEFHVVFENEYSGNFFNSAWRQFRKRNAYPTAITQNVEYLLDSVQASTMLSNSEFIVMLNQAASDREKLARLLNISNEQMSYVTNADAGCGLIKYGSALVPFVNRFPKDTQLYKLMTTKPGEGVFGGEGKEVTA